MYNHVSKNRAIDQKLSADVDLSMASQQEDYVARFLSKIAKRSCGEALITDLARTVLGLTGGELHAAVRAFEAATGWREAGQAEGATEEMEEADEADEAEEAEEAKTTNTVGAGSSGCSRSSSSRSSSSSSSAATTASGDAEDEDDDDEEEKGGNVACSICPPGSGKAAGHKGRHKGQKKNGGDDDDDDDDSTSATPSTTRSGHPIGRSSIASLASTASSKTGKSARIGKSTNSSFAAPLHVDPGVALISVPSNASKVRQKEWKDQWKDVLVAPGWSVYSIKFTSSIGYYFCPPGGSMNMQQDDGRDVI